MKTFLVVIGILIAIALGAVSLGVNLNRQGKQGIQGEQGIQGIQGERGVQGFQGIAGSNGKNGIDGKNGTNGKDGAQGVQGLTGATGAVGASGSQGPMGVQGVQGVTGATGSQGAQGIAGTSVEYRAGTGVFTAGTSVVVFSSPLSTANYSIAILGNDSYTISNKTISGFAVTSNCAPFVWFAIVNK